MFCKTVPPPPPEEKENVAVSPGFYVKAKATIEIPKGIFLYGGYATGWLTDKQSLEGNVEDLCVLRERLDVAIKRLSCGSQD